MSIDTQPFSDAPAPTGELAFTAVDKAALDRLWPFVGNIIGSLRVDAMNRLAAMDEALRPGGRDRACAFGRTCRMPPEQRCRRAECSLTQVE